MSEEIIDNTGASKNSGSKKNIETRNSSTIFRIAVSVVLVLLLTGCSYLLCSGFVFSSNDDAMLRNIANGTYTGTPEAHLVYISYVGGLIFKGLYSLIPAVPWYDLIMIGLHCLSWVCIIVKAGSLFTKKRHQTPVMILACLFLIFLDIRFFAMHQYTILAGVICGAAIFLLASGERDKAPGRSESFTIGFLMTAAFILRRQVFLMALPFGLMLVLRFVISNYKSNIKEVRRMLILAGSILALAGAVFLTDRLAYSSPEWKEFNAYNTYRTDVYDFYGVPDYGENADRYNEIGIDEKEYMCLYLYDITLDETMNGGKFADFAALSKDAWNSNASYRLKHSVLDFFKACWDGLGEPAFISGLIILIALAVIAVRTKRVKEIIFPAAAVLYSGVVAWFFIYRSRFPERVSYGLLFELVMFLAAFGISAVKDIFARGKDISGRKQLIAVTVLSAAVSLVLIVAITVSTGRMNSKIMDCKLNISRWEHINAYVTAHSENMYFIDTHTAATGTERMNNVSLEADNIVRLGTWTAGGPLYEKRLKNQGITNVADAILSDNSYVILPGDYSADWLAEYFGDGYKAVETDRIVSRDGTEYRVVQVCGE